MIGEESQQHSAKPPRQKEGVVFRKKYSPVPILFSLILPLAESCWGVPSQTLLMRLAPLKNPSKYFFRIFQKQFRFTPRFSPISERTPRTERRFYHAKTIQHAAPQPGSQDTHDRGRIRRVCGKAFCLQHEPSRVYPASHNRGSHTPHHNRFPVNDELLAAVGKLTAEYGRIGGNLNQIARTLNEWHSPYPQLAGEVRAAVSDLAALKFEVLQKVGDAVGNIQTYQL